MTDFQVSDAGTLRAATPTSDDGSDGAETVVEKADVEEGTDPRSAGQDHLRQHPAAAVCRGLTLPWPRGRAGFGPAGALVRCGRVVSGPGSVAAG